MKKWIVGFLGIIGVILMICGIIIKNRKCRSIAIIGAADGPTAIYVAGKLGSDFWIELIIFGVILVIIMIVLFILRKKKR